MEHSTIINKNNPLASVGRFTGAPVHKISVNTKTNELVLTTSTNDSHALIQANFGQKGRDEKSSDWARGIYDAKNNVLGIRVPDSVEYGYGEDLSDEEVMAKAFDYQYDVYERFLAGNPSLKICFNLTNNDLNKFYESLDSTKLDPKRIFSADTLFPQHASDIEVVANPYSLAITPNKEKFSTVDKVAPVFKRKRFKEWNNDLVSISNSLKVNVDDLWETVGRWEKDVEPSYIANLSDSRKNIFKTGCFLAKKYQQDAAMFIKANTKGKQAVAEIKLHSSADLNDVHAILSEQGFPGSSVTIGESSLVVALLDDESKGKLNGLVKTLEEKELLESGEFNVYPADVTIIDSSQYDKYLV
jgi:hypothetical protein